jgi:hypothetical protein
LDRFEKIIIYGVWIVSFASVWFIPKDKRRHASFIFLFSQFPAWILGLLVVEAGYIEYPVREFAKANSTSFSFEYFVLPLLCVFFNLNYPSHKSIAKKLLYIASIMSSFTLIELLTEKYTRIIKYVNWESYWTLISMTLVFYFVRVVYKWFYNLGSPFSL